MRHILGFASATTRLSFFWVDPGAMVRKVANSYVSVKIREQWICIVYIVQCTSSPSTPPPLINSSLYQMFVTMYTVQHCANGHYTPIFNFASPRRAPQCHAPLFALIERKTLC